jgi:phage-related protein
MVYQVNAINWKNINLQSSYERNLNLIERLTFDCLLLEIDCNLPEINEATVRQQFEKDLNSRIEEAKAIFEDNLDNLVKYANSVRNSD